MRASGLKVAPFFDAEFTVKFMLGETMDATFADHPVISPNQRLIDIFVASLEPFWRALSSDMYGRDSHGRPVLFV